jgi:hypothetical protein
MSDKYLTDEERAALAAPEDSAETDIETLESIANEGEEAEPEETVFIPAMHVEDTRGVPQALETLQQERQALMSRYRDGDITVEDLLTEQESLNERMTDLRMRASQAEFAAHQNENVRQSLWGRAQDQFFADHDEYRRSPALWGALDGAVKAIAREPANANRSGRSILAEAHRVVKQFRADQGTDAPYDEAPQGAADLASLDELTGLEYEEALARLSPEEQTRYLES